MIITWPQKIRKASVNDHICAAWDIFPTICDITGEEHPDGLDGISLMPTIIGRGEQKEHDYLYWEYPERRGQQAVRLHNWKGIRDSTRDGNLKIQLFNLENDIAEEKDISKQFTNIVKQIEDIMIKEHEKPEIERFDPFPI
jgi:arylsulfatase